MKRFGWVAPRSAFRRSRDRAVQFKNEVLQQMDKSEVQEDLLSLYLRLNGFFVSSLIVHSHQHGHNRTEIDALAVRFPHNSEPERKVGPDEYLETSAEHIDLLICEVKSGGSPLRFNPALLKESTCTYR